MRELPTINEPVPVLHLAPEEIESLSAEVRDLARERDAVILAHNYQVPEVQDIADFVGDSLALSRQAAASEASVIAFCGVHFMAETASILSPEKTVLIPDLEAGCSLADSITASELRNWKARHGENAREVGEALLRLRGEIVLAHELAARVERDLAGYGDAVAEALARLHARGVPCFYIHGNRDFLIGDAYARRARMTLLPDPSIVNIEGRRTALMHGDTLCIDDTAYQDFRRLTRAPAWQRDFTGRSVDERRRFADAARAESQRHTRSVDETITDVNADAVAATFAASSVDRMIHGHTHRPAIHATSLSRGSAERIVLGDWYEQGSVLTLDDRGVSLSSL